MHYNKVMLFTIKDETVAKNRQRKLYSEIDYERKKEKERRRRAKRRRVKNPRVTAI